MFLFSTAVCLLCWLGLQAPAGLLALLPVSLCALHAYCRSFWTRRGLHSVPPAPLLGNFSQSSLGRRLFFQDQQELYEALKQHGCGGAFQLWKPVLLVCDPELAKQILTTDFSAAPVRGIAFDEKRDHLSAHLFNLNGSRWKSLRARLAPTFTTGTQLKLLLPLMQEVSSRLEEVLCGMVAAGGEVQLAPVLCRFAADLISSCAFGVDSDCLRQPDAPFYRMSREIFRPSVLYQWRRMLGSLSPTLALWFISAGGMFPRSHTFFLDLMRRSAEFREQHGVVRHDMVHAMLAIRSEQRASRERGTEPPFDLTYELMAAQAFAFFLAGGDNVAHVVAFCLHELALQQHLQDRAVAEIQAALHRHGGTLLPYEALSELPYLDMVLDEALRLYTPVTQLFRQVRAERYPMPGTTGAELRRGQDILVPVWAMHRDARLYPEPERFDPERFSPEARRARHPYAFLPFGQGPRGCIAVRFVRLEMKLALVTLLAAFSFSVGASTQHPVPLVAKTRNPTPSNGVPLRVQARRQQRGCLIATESNQIGTEHDSA